MHTQELTEEVLSCIEICQSCHQMCLETVNHCLLMGGPHADADHIRLLLDCAQVCQTAADFMSRGSDFHAYVCGLCAEICEQCADDCGALSDDDEHMSKCEEECRICAETCQSMSGL